MKTKKVSNKVAHKRRDMGLKQEELAKRAKISRPMLSNIERGEAFPSLLAAHRIAKALNSTIDEVFFGTNVQKMNKNKIA